MMTFQPGALWPGMLEEAMGQRCTSLGATYREYLQRPIPYPQCSAELTAGYMMSHQRRMHRTEPEIDWNWLMFSHTEHLPQVYEINFPKGIAQCLCPSFVCPVSSRNCNMLWNHFNRPYWGVSIRILEYHPFPLS